MTPRLPIVILISGRGSNMQAILDQVAHGTLPVDIRAVISNRPEASGLETARVAGIDTAVVDHREYASRDAYDRALQAAIDRYAPDLVVLAGFMRILTPDFVRHFQGRLLNIHPSLLPALRGLHTHRRALEAGLAEHGASVHFVTEELDGGPVIAQIPVPVQAGDTEADLALRVLQQEHRLYPAVIDWFASGRLRYRDGAAWLDGRPLLEPQRLDTVTAEV
ncbi:MAG: phosphoribosylglycinamide formyltransferase [Gammaproteobacteria bacterium]|nr:phosphoribosylglycinamide formyltransferase [Gammaproteobacteria bacterium]